MKLQKCPCHYQKEHHWRYDSMMWSNGEWQKVGTNSDPSDALAAAKLDIQKPILIVCNGCGSQLYRDNIFEHDPAKSS